MSIIRINLIPSRRRSGLEIHRRGRRWTAICVVWTMLLLALYGTSRFLPGNNLKPFRQEITRRDDDIVRLNQSLANTRAELATWQQNLDAALALKSQPDWSTLLAVVARELGDDVILNACQLQMAAPGSAVSLSVPSMPMRADNVLGPEFILQLKGIARAQGNIAQFAIRLGESDLFAKVQILQSSRQTLRDREAYTFQIECRLKGRGRVVQ